MMQATINTQHIDAVLKEFPQRVQRDVVNAAASRGATVVRKFVRQNLKQINAIDTGDLYRAIRSRKVKRVHGVYTIYTDSSAFHAHLVEYGTGPRKLKKPTPFEIAPGEWITLENTGSMPAKPFFRPALDERQGEILNEMRERAAKRMAKEAEKMSQKYSKLSKNYKRKLLK